MAGNSSTFYLRQRTNESNIKQWQNWSVDINYVVEQFNDVVNNLVDRLNLAEMSVDALNVKLNNQGTNYVKLQHNEITIQSTDKISYSATCGVYSNSETGDNVVYVYANMSVPGLTLDDTEVNLIKQEGIIDVSDSSGNKTIRKTSQRVILPEQYENSELGDDDPGNNHDGDNTKYITFRRHFKSGNSNDYDYIDVTDGYAEVDKNATQYTFNGIAKGMIDDIDNIPDAYKIFEKTIPLTEETYIYTLNGWSLTSSPRSEYINFDSNPTTINLNSYDYNNNGHAYYAYYIDVYAQYSSSQVVTPIGGDDPIGNIDNPNGNNGETNDLNNNVYHVTFVWHYKNGDGNDQTTETQVDVPNNNESYNYTFTVIGIQPSSYISNDTTYVFNKWTTEQNGTGTKINIGTIINIDEFTYDDEQHNVSIDIYAYYKEEGTNDTETAIYYVPFMYFSGSDMGTMHTFKTLNAQKINANIKLYFSLESKLLDLEDSSITASLPINIQYSRVITKSLYTIDKSSLGKALVNSVPIAADTVSVQQYEATYGQYSTTKTVANIANNKNKVRKV